MPPQFVKPYVKSQKNDAADVRPPSRRPAALSGLPVSLSGFDRTRCPQSPYYARAWISSRGSCGHPSRSALARCRAMPRNHAPWRILRQCRRLRIIALEMIGPMPGTLMARWQCGSCLAIEAISSDSAAMRSRPTRTLPINRIGRAASAATLACRPSSSSARSRRTGRSGATGFSGRSIEGGRRRVKDFGQGRSPTFTMSRIVQHTRVQSTLSLFHGSPVMAFSISCSVNPTARCHAFFEGLTAR